MDKRFKPLPGDFGTEATQCGRALGASPVTASSTVKYSIPTSVRKMYLRDASCSLTTVAAGGGAITAQIFKVPSGNGTPVALTSTLDLVAGVAVGTNTSFVIPTTVTDAQRLFLKGDVLQVQVVAASTVTTQPVDVNVGVGMLIQV